MQGSRFNRRSTLLGAAPFAALVAGLALITGCPGTPPGGGNRNRNVNAVANNNNAPPANNNNAAPNINEPNVNEPNVNEPNVNEPNVNEPNVNEPNVNEPNGNEPTGATVTIAGCPDMESPRDTAVTLSGTADGFTGTATFMWSVSAGAGACSSRFSA